MFYKSIVSLFISLCLCASAHAAQLTVNKIAAVVNGEMITLHELRRYVGAELSRQRIPPNDPQVAEIQTKMLDSMINDILIRQEAKRYSVTVSDADVEEEFRKTLSRSGLSQAKLDEELKKQGSSREVLKKRIANNMLRQRMGEFMIVRKIIVTREEVEEYYKKNPSEFLGTKTADFSILMLPEKLDAQGIYKQVRSGTLSFEDAVTKYSADKSAQSQGRVSGVPWDKLPGDMQKMLSSLTDGQLSPLLRTQGGFVVIRRNQISDAKPLTFKEATPIIEEIIRAPRLEERLKEYTTQLRAKAVIDIRI